MGDERKVSWSCGDRIRLVGFLKSRVERSGGEGRFGVSGMGRGLEGGACRRRGCSFGKRSFRFGIPAASLSFSMVGDSVVEGILALMLFGDSIYQWSREQDMMEGRKDPHLAHPKLIEASRFYFTA